MTGFAVPWSSFWQARDRNRLYAGASDGLATSQLVLPYAVPLKRNFAAPSILIFFPILLPPPFQSAVLAGRCILRRSSATTSS